MTTALDYLSKTIHQEFLRRCDHTQGQAIRYGTVSVLSAMPSFFLAYDLISLGSPSWPFLKSSFDHLDHEDLLPPFSMLTNDEDRERKAMHKLPGTYHIVVNPDSFASLEEHGDSQDDEFTAGIRLQSPIKRRRSSVYISTSVIRQDVFEDPDTLIIGKFEENLRKLPTLSLLTTHFNSSRSSSLTSISPATTYVQSAHTSQSQEISPLFETVWEAEEDQNIAFFYRTFVRTQLNQVHRDSLGTSSDLGIQTVPDVLEQQAPQFTPVRIYIHTSPIPRLVWSR